MAGTTVQLGNFSPSTNAAITSAPAGIIADIVSVATNVANRLGLSTAQTLELQRTSVVTAQTESGFNPNVNIIDSNGLNSVGLYNLNAAGELQQVPGSTLAQKIANAKNPITNARVAIGHIGAVLKGAGPTPDLGAVAASAQGPEYPVAYAHTIDNALNGGTVPYTSRGVSVLVPKGTDSAAAAAAAGAGGAGGGLLTKIGAFLVGLVLLGVGVAVLFKGDTPAPVKSAMKVVAA